MLEGRALAVCGGLSPSAVLSSTLFVYACHSRGALPAHWPCRVFSGAVKNSRGARKLARTPHANKKKSMNILPHAGWNKLFCNYLDNGVLGSS